MAADLRFVLATRSAHKAAEVRQILARTRIELVTLDDAGVAFSPAEESIEAFDTFRANALAKAAYYASVSGMPALADDSGICVTALGGAPGVFSKRFSGRTDLTGQALDDANNAHLIARLAQAGADRSAHYVCVAAVARPDGASCCAVGTVLGNIVEQPRGHGGFGYDPYFLLPSLNRTFGELDALEKHRHSHRARAFRALAVMLG